MKDWKRKAAAMGMAAVVMAPGMAYGQSANTACDVNKAYQQIQNIKACYEAFQKEEGTYCGDWNRIFQQLNQLCQKPETNAPETDLPETSAPEENKPETSAPETDAPEVNLPETNAPETEQKPETSKPPVQENRPGSGDQAADESTGEAASAVAREMLAQVNEERRAAGLSELTLSTELSQVAQAKAEDMRDKGYFSHTSPTYGSPFDMMKKFGISYRSAGENIAKGYRSVSAVMNGWMNSSGHRANILNSSYTQLGVGYCTDSAGNGYWVQIFIRQ